MERDGEFLRQALLPNGTVSVQAIAAARGSALGEVFRSSPLAHAAELGAARAQAGSGALTEFERACDDAVTAYMARAHRVPFGEAPVLGYLHAKEQEMTAIRTIDACEGNRLKTALRVLLFRIFTRFFADFTEEIEDGVPPWLSHLCNEMQRNGNFTYGIERMLSLTDKSREHVSRCMKRYMGITLSDFINGLRLHFVANMLENSNHGVADIVFESGFGNLSWAAELFRKKYGCTMSEYRKRHQTG
jgi:AraC-like DNA-binding protein